MKSCKTNKTKIQIINPSEGSSSFPIDLDDPSLDYNFEDKERFWSDCMKSLPEKPFIRDNKKNLWLNVALSFDIETTSFYQHIYIPNKQVLKPLKDEEDDYYKASTMYAWVFGFNGRTIVGRTWKEAISIFNDLVYFLDLHLANNPDKEEKGAKTAIVYIHNEAFEFQYIKDRFVWDSVFALEAHKPLKARTSTGIEFRCSYLLTGYALRTVGKHLHKYKIEKMDGDLDYRLFRHSQTPLTAKEWGYIRHDAKIPMAHIQEEIERLGSIDMIPLTKTGYVRKYCRDCCLYDGGHKKNGLKWKRYHELMLSLQIKSELEYKQLKYGFQGGFTHAGCFYSGKIVDDVTSMDETSAYPSVMITEKFPCGTGTIVEPKSKREFNDYLKRYCCLFDVEFENLEATFVWEHYLSSSRCWDIKGEITDNGRVVSATMVKTTITEQDYMILKATYRWSSMKIRNMRVYMKQYLPTDFVKSIVKLYKDKTQLKGVKGSELEYQHSKENVNSAYGMTVTDIAKEENKYIKHEWVTEPVDLKKVLSKYNIAKNRFLCYQWGVWVTAYARRNVWSAILECASDYCYSDTDSVKTRHYEDHKAFFEQYNKDMLLKLKHASEFHHIPLSDLMPKTIDGVEKPLGVWDYDGHYIKFKSLGAKRYMVLTKKGYSLTVSGVNKDKAIPYLIKESARIKKEKGVTITPMEMFQEGLHLPPEATGKNIHSYLDYPQEGILVDYLGVPFAYNEKSSVHLEPTGYDLSLSDDYVSYLKGIIEDYI